MLLSGSPQPFRRGSNQLFISKNRPTRICYVQKEYPEISGPRVSNPKTVVLFSFALAELVFPFPINGRNSGKVINISL